MNTQMADLMNYKDKKKNGITATEYRIWYLINLHCLLIDGVGLFSYLFFSESKCDEMNAMRAEQVNKNHLNPSTVSYNSSSLFFALFPFPSEFSIAISPLAIGHPASHIPFLFENARNLTPFPFFLVCSIAHSRAIFICTRRLLFYYFELFCSSISHAIGNGFFINLFLINENCSMSTIFTRSFVCCFISLFYFVSHYMCVVSVVMFICIADGHHFCLFCFSMLFRQRFQRFLFTCCI